MERRVWELLPRADINLYGYFSDVPTQYALGIISDNNEISSFSINGRQIEGFRVSSGGDAIAKEFNLKWSPSREPVNVVGDDSTKMIKAVFHLFNFVDMMGARRSIEVVGTTEYCIENIDLRCEKWKIELRSLITTKENIEALKGEGGYRLTHIGRIQKIDGDQFSGKEAEECLYALRFFLSFAKGGWCEPCCAVGFDISGNRVWESWSSPREPWYPLPSWFDPHNASQLLALFPGLMKRWKNEDWRKALHEVIYWYINSNFSPRGIDAGIILTQAAIGEVSLRIFS